MSEKYEKAIKALQEISEARGIFSRDKLQMAMNTIENMQNIAVEVLRELGEEIPRESLE
jgi:hypothetical protein